MRSRGEGCLVAWLLGVCLRKFLEPAAIGDPKLFCQASRSDFNPALVESQSKAAKFVCNWLRALSGYDEARPHSIHVSCYRGTSGPRTLFKLEVYRSTAGLRDRASQMESEAALTRGLVTERQAGLRNMRRLFVAKFVLKNPALNEAELQSLQAKARFLLPADVAMWV